MSDAYESRAAQVEAYVRAWHPVPRQQGVVVAIDGRPVGLELFDSAAAFSRYLEKLTRSGALALDGRVVHLAGFCIDPLSRGSRA